MTNTQTTPQETTTKPAAKGTRLEHYYATLDLKAHFDPVRKINALLGRKPITPKT